MQAASLHVFGSRKRCLPLIFDFGVRNCEGVVGGSKVNFLAFSSLSSGRGGGCPAKLDPVEKTFPE